MMPLMDEHKFYIVCDPRRAEPVETVGEMGPQKGLE